MCCTRLVVDNGRNRMSLDDPLIFLALVILAALPLAWAIYRLDRWNKWRKIINAVEQPTIKRSDVSNVQIADEFNLRERAILPPYKSAARPSNVMALAKRKAVGK
jgi:hypothetical protein